MGAISYRSRTDTKSLPLGLFKVRITYDDTHFQIDYDKYSPRTIQSLKIVHTQDYDYTYKASDRSGLKSLYEQKGKCDDILIVKNGLVTDTYYTNVAFLQKGTWYTPKSPLLPGTMRQKLLDQGKIVKKDIPIDSIYKYSAVSLFNALNLHKSCIVKLKNVVIK